MLHNNSNVVCKKGDEADRLFVIMSGTVEIVVNEVKVRDMIENDFFGEGSLITGDHERGATVNAVIDAKEGVVTTLTLSKEDFNVLVKNKVITAEVVEILTQRHQKWQREDEKRGDGSSSGMVPPPPMMSGHDGNDIEINSDFEGEV